MTLSDEVKAALERLHRNEYRVFGESSYDCEIVARAMLELFPVREVGGMVMRYDDQITAARLIACGFFEKDNRLVCSKNELLWRDESVSRKYPARPTWRVGGAYLVDSTSPRNMGEVWELMERCGVDIGVDKAAQQSSIVGGKPDKPTN
jgi:hypothetical protein